MTRRLYLAFLVLILAIPVGLSALWVDEKELAGGQPVEFRNFSGDYSVSETEAEIGAIGKRLAEISVSNFRAYTAGDAYTVIHAIDTNSSNRLSADLLLVGRASKARHINAVRLVLSSYLSARYGYTVAEGRVLALFITWYNGLHRGDMAFFGQKYCPAALSNLDAANAGIASNYQDWPGKTKIVIPLTPDNLQIIRPVDPGEISEKKVIEALRLRADKGVPERKELLAVKEKEVQERKKDAADKAEKAADKKEAVKTEEKNLEKKKDELAAAKEAARQKEEDLKDKKKEAATAKTDEEIKKAAEKVKKAEEIVKTAKEDTAKKENEVKKEEKTVAEKKDEAAKAVKEAETAKEKAVKTEIEVKADKEAIRKDEAEVKAANDPKKLKEDLVKKDTELAKKEEALSNRETAIATNEQKIEEKKKELDVRENELKTKKRDDNVFAGKLYYLRVRNFFGEGRYHNDLYVINGLTRQLEKRSVLTNISGKKFDVFMDGVAVIAQPDEKTPDALAMLDRETLEVKAWSKESVFWRSSVEVRDDSVYAVTISNNVFWLGKWNSKLELQNRSAVEVDRDTSFSFYGEYIYVSNPEKIVLALNRKDLTSAGEVTETGEK